MQVRPAPTVTTIIDTDDDEDHVHSSVAPGSKSARDDDEEGEEPVNSEDELGQPIFYGAIQIKSLTLMYRAPAKGLGFVSLCILPSYS